MLGGKPGQRLLHGLHSPEAPGTLPAQFPRKFFLLAAAKKIVLSIDRKKVLTLRQRRKFLRHRG